jgi:hypothetical protein
LIDRRHNAERYFAMAAEANSLRLA